MRILELTLAVADLDRARQFYTSFLGFREVEPRQVGQLAIQVGATRLSFVLAGANARPRYHFAFEIPAGRLDAGMRWLRQRHGLLASSAGETRFLSENWNAENVYFADLEGNILELICARPLAAQPPQPAAEAPFDASEILGVCEIGVAADSVANAAAELTGQFSGLAVYPPGSSAPLPTDNFAALGGDHGRLILVKPGRIWFPDTGVPAEFASLDVLVEVQPGQQFRLFAPPFPYATRAETA